MCYRLIQLLNPLAGALWITPAALALILFMLLLPRGAAAEESSAQPALPDQVIREVTEQVMQVVSEANTYFDEEPERYYREIDAALAALVDWRGFATAVMGDYYSRGRSMDSAGRTKLKRQRDEFAETLREGLIRVTPKDFWLLVARKWKFRVLRPRHSARIASMTQLVYGEAIGSAIRYQMGQYKDGAWRLRNLIIETINLGEIYRNQFSALAKEANETSIW